MRIDLFLKLVGITKTRMAAKRLCDLGQVSLQGRPLKPSHELSGGETLGIRLPQREFRLRVLELPAGHSVAKKDRARFHEILSNDPD